MRSLRQDLLLGVRSLRKEPLSAVITSLTLPLATGLCTISFSLLYGVFFRDLGVPEADRLAVSSRINPARQTGTMPVRVHDFYDWSAQQTAFESLAGYSTGTVDLAGAERPERYDGAFVSANLFDALRVRPTLGSSLRSEDDRIGAPLTVVLGLLMFEVAPRDPEVFALVVAVILAIGVLESLVPAHRATRTEPTAALRAE